LETKAVLKALSQAHRPLAELKGLVRSIPNQGILIDTLSLQEAKASSEIENIITTQDDLFQTNISKSLFATPEAKEVALYSRALHCGFARLIERDGIITNNSIIEMFQLLKNNSGGFRETPGTALKNEATGEIVFVPPQDKHEIIGHMTGLEAFINATSEEGELDPLIKMALIHHQFESIHPFPDGNGRLGRILNVLYLVQQGLLGIPALYISGYITRNKDDYYNRLQNTRDTGDWEAWVLYMLEAVRVTALDTIELITQLRELLSTYKNIIRDQHPKIYSHELINNLFKHPYTRIEYVVEEVGVGRQTASRYLNELCAAGLLEKYKSGLNNYYINAPLVALLAKSSP
jgi:Fic family protein